MILEKFIIGTNKKYSITENGIVYSNYKICNNGKKFYKRVEVAKYLNTPKSKSLVVNLQFGKYSEYNKMKTLCISTLMEKHFSLRPPDKYHFYDLDYKDGNYLNTSLDNLVYKIRTLGDEKYYPQPFYNGKGKITHKICKECGIKKDIGHFHLQNPKDNNRTYRNKCETCRSKLQWENIKSDSEKKKRFIENHKRWSNSEKGKKYHRKYDEAWRKFQRDNITESYISSIYKMKIKDLTPELILLTKKSTNLKRTINQNTK